ncbi:MAG TPA: hypothetical protein VGR00_01185, partial [Thermoanaerobaculia bacterium]|nr:hypothetical protein [Thermoanaerobaculia bacterium]
AADFASASVITDLSTRNLLISFPTTPNVSATLFFRVAAVGGCGREGAFSATATISVAANPPSLVVTQEQTPDWLVSPGQLPPVATVKFKNVGGAPASVTFRPRGGFFTISPTTANLDPGQETTVTVTPLAGITNAMGAQQGSLTADYGSGSVSTSINLSVAGSSTSGIAPSLAQDEILIVNKRSSTRPPLAPATTIVKVTNPGNQPIFLVPTIGPGGAWLKLEPTDFGKTIPPGASQDIHLSADPSAITPSDYPLPIWTVLTLTPAGGSNADEARVKVFYNEEISVESGAGRGFLASGESSFIVPTSVHKTGAGDTIFTSDGWLRNLSPDPVDFTIYAAPSGQNGQLNAFRVEQTIPPFATLRLFDFIYGLFGNTDLAAHVEIRSAKAGNLSVRTTASGLPGTGDATARYGTEIPVFGAGTGTGVGLPPLILTGIKVTDAFRLNVILAETTGTAAKVNLALYDSSGALVAQNAVDVPAAGNIQNSLFGFLNAPETKVESGSLSIEPVSGSGRVVAIV